MSVQDTALADIPGGLPSNVIPLAGHRPRRKLSVCLLGYRSAPFTGGQGIYLRYLSKALLEAGHEVDVISGQPYPDLVPGVRLIKMPGLNLYENGLGSLRPRHLSSWTNIVEWLGKLTGSFSEPYCFGQRALKYLREHGRHYDVIHDNQCLAWGMLKLQKEGFPLVTTIHHPITSDLEIALRAAANWRERLLIRRWHNFITMQRKVAQKLRNVVTVSERSRQDIAMSFGIREQAMELVYCGIDTGVFKPMPEVHSVPGRLMVTASADHPLKGVRYLLEALAIVVHYRPDVELLMVGKPKVGGETEKLIARLGLQERIFSVSGISTEALVRHYCEAEVVVVPSVYEGFGLPAGEAMACGAPLVSTDGGALPEVVGDAGMVVPVRNSKALAEAIIQLLDDPEKRLALSRAGRHRMETTFCWSRAAGQMSDWYEKVIDRADG